MTGSGAESGTSISEISDGFQRLRALTEARYGIALQLVRIHGKRWEYAAGKLPAAGEMSIPERIEASPCWGLVVYGSEKLMPGPRESLLGLLRAWDPAALTATKDRVLRALRNSEPAGLFREADRVRKEHCGDEIHLRGIIEFSNHCKRDCLYCGIRRSNARLYRYRMSPEEILSSAREAVCLGYKTVVLQSGEDDAYDTGTLCGIVRKIKRECGCAVTLAVGEKRHDDYARFKNAGVDRYLLKIETGDRDLFKQLKPDSSLEARMDCLLSLKDLGFQTGSGVMIGLPGSTLETLADDLLLLAGLDLDMIGVGPFIPHPDTPLAGAAGGDSVLTLKSVALLRILTLNAHLPATTALGSVDSEGRQKALRGGANVIMPNVTPAAYRKYYEIYPGKICIGEQPGDCRGCLAGMAGALGRRISEGRGHSLKRNFATAKTRETA